jgi:putative flippase GtrA
LNGPDAPLARLLARYRALLIFGAIGVVNTLLHSGTVVFLVERALAGPVPANVAGFAVANTASYFANCRFTFRQAPSWRRYRAFVTVSLLSLVLTIGLSTLAQAMHWHYLVGLLLVLLCGPVLTYALHKAVTFRHPA